MKTHILRHIATLLSFALLSTSQSYATHAMGMDLTYTCLGGNTYQFQLAFYRDCGGVAAPPNPSINFTSVSCNQNFNQTLALFSSGETTPICASLATECTGGAFPGAEEYIYRGIVVLPAQCNDWIMSYTICCRNNDINTINNPGGESIYVETTLDNTVATCNSSPTFSNDPVPFICANQLYCFNNGAVDADGDSLVYSLVVPKTGPNLGDTVNFLAGYTAGSPITSSPALSLDPVTGDLCMTPTDSTEIGVLAILVEEYRNGVKIGSIKRDIQLRILGCPNGNVSPSVSGIDGTGKFSTKVCAGDTISFDVTSIDPDTGQTVTMSWNNGIPAATFTINTLNRPVGSFFWVPANTDIRSTPYCFTVTVSDDNCPFEASQVYSFCIFITGITSLVDSIQPPSCNGDCDGVGAVEIVNGTPPFTYAWNDPASQTTPIANGLCTGIYTITGTDSVGCVTTTNLAIIEPALLTSNAIVTSNYNGRDISCTGFSDGAASANITGGTPPYNFSWGPLTGNQTSDTAINLSSGTYSYVVTDANNCDTNGTVILSDPPPVIGNTSVVSDYNGRMISCFGGSDGMISTNGNGGTAPYTYQWDINTNNQVTDTAIGLSSGVYSVVITDANNCDTTLIDSLTDPPALASITSIASNYNGAPISCNGVNDGIADVAASGGTAPYFFQWGINTGNQTGDSAFNLAAGTYYVTIKDTNSCQKLDSITINDPDPVLANILSQKNVYCNGDSSGEASANATGGTAPYRYQWNTTPITLDSTISNLPMGNYIVTVTDTNGCIDDTTLSITESQPIVINASGIDLICNNGNDGRAFATPTGGNPPYNYVWNTNTGIQTSDTAENLSAGWHFVFVTDSLNCTSEDSTFLIEPGPINLITSNDDTTCAGQATQISAIASGGIGTYSYQWNEGLGTQSSHTVNPTNTTIYIVKAIDSLGCESNNGIVNVRIRNFDEDSMYVQVLGNVCEGDTSTVVAAHIANFDNYTYSWTPNLGTDIGPFEVTPTENTTYVLQISDICGNTITDSANIEVFPNPEVSIPPLFAEGCVPLEVQFEDSLINGNDYTYSWNLGDNTTTIDPRPKHTYLMAGNYTISLEITSPMGCTSRGSVNSLVRAFESPLANFTADPLTATTQNSIITFEDLSTSATSFQWQFGDGDSSTARNPIHTYLDSGSFVVQLRVENENGCIDSVQQSIRIDRYFDIKIPNAFTPNPNASSGGKYDPNALNNDVFFPHTEGVNGYHLMIFNRWGELIFESFDHSIGWDGYYRGELAQQEVYVWKLDISWINGKKLTKTGDLTLFR